MNLKNTFKNQLLALGGTKEEMRDSLLALGYTIAYDEKRFGPVNQYLRDLHPNLPDFLLSTYGDCGVRICGGQVYWYLFSEHPELMALNDFSNAYLPD